VQRDRLYLHHMLERCRRITRFIGPGREAFMASEELQDAVIRNVASSRIPELQAALEEFLAGASPDSPPVP
jgi:uncharacterized protein with HEPN domain